MFNLIVNINGIMEFSVVGLWRSVLFSDMSFIPSKRTMGKILFILAIGCEAESFGSRLVSILSL